MSTKDVILSTLEHSSTYISGEELGRKLGVSRAMINKSINELRGEGYEISSRTKKGYILNKKVDKLSEPIIRNHITCGYDIRLLDNTTSTNNELKRLMLETKNDKLCVIAKEQTEGKGRMNRTYYSAEGGIYLSILFKPDFTNDIALKITCATAVGVCRAIEKNSSLEPKIKWINDIYLNSKKCCGILTQAMTNFETSQIESVIVGIGLNYNIANFPDELKGTATDIVRNDENANSINSFASSIINEVVNAIENITDEAIMTEYKNKSCVIGKDVNVISLKETRRATVLDIDSNGELVVRYESGEVEKIFSGEISIREV